MRAVYAPLQDSVLAIGIVICVTLVLFGLGIVLFWMYRVPSSYAFDFKAELARMVASGELGIARQDVNESNVPREVKRASVKLGHSIGQGEFGQVMKGTLDESNLGGPPGTFLVAVKVCSENASHLKERNLLREAAVMAQVCCI